MTDWTNILWFAANLMLAAASLMCLGKLIELGNRHLLTRLSYTITPVGAGIAIAGFLQDKWHAVYLGELLEIIGMLIISVRIYLYLAKQAYTGPERRRQPDGAPAARRRRK